MADYGLFRRAAGYIVAYGESQQQKPQRRVANDET